jgi:uncharacterized protein
MLNALGISQKSDDSGSWICSRVVRIALLLALVALLPACASLDEWQRRKVYRPTPIPSIAVWETQLRQRPGLQTRSVPVGAAGEHVQLLRVPAQQEGQTSSVRVLYLHGTFRHALQNLGKTVPMQQSGLDVWLLDYRGWGIASHRLPDEASIHEDAWTAWQALQADAAAAASPEGQAPVRWIIYGHSMGSAVATRLARRLQGQSAYCALVLESSFTSFSDIAWNGAGLLGRLLAGVGNQRMAAIDDIGHVDGPVWFLHGSQDDTVPMALGRRMFERAPEPKFWREWPLDHSNLQTDPTGRYAQTWKDIAAQCDAGH